MTVVRIATSKIVDWDSFHTVFAEALGFPEFYGRNMNAWIDCLTYADEDDGMRSITVAPGSMLTLQLNNVGGFRSSYPELYAAIVEGCAFVNWRRIEAGQPAVVALAFHE